MFVIISIKFVNALHEMLCFNSCNIYRQEQSGRSRGVRAGGVPVVGAGASARVGARRGGTALLPHAHANHVP